MLANICTHLRQLLISCFATNVYIIKETFSHNDGNKINNSLFLFFSAGFRGIGDLQQSEHEKAK